MIRCAGDKMLKKEKIKMLFALTIIIIFTVGFLAGCLGGNEPEKGKIRYGGQYYPEEFLLQGKDFWSN